MAITKLATPSWLPYGKTEYVTGDDDPVHGAEGSINRTARTLWSHLRAIGKGNSGLAFDSILIAWKDANTVTLKAGGYCVSDNGENIYAVGDSDVDVTLSGNLDTGTKAPSTLYFLYIGESSGNVVVKFSTNSSTPTGLSNYHRLRWTIRNDSSSDIIPFEIAGDYYHYLSSILFAGTDKTQLFSGTSPTSGSPGSLSLAGFAPPGARGCVHLQSQVANWTTWPLPHVAMISNGLVQLHTMPLYVSGATVGILLGRLDVPYACQWYTWAACASTQIVLEGWWN